MASESGTRVPVPLWVGAGIVIVASLVAIANKCLVSTDALLRGFEPWAGVSAATRAGDLLVIVAMLWLAARLKGVGAVGAWLAVAGLFGRLAGHLAWMGLYSYIAAHPRHFPELVLHGVQWVFACSGILAAIGFGLAARRWWGIVLGCVVGVVTCPPPFVMDHVYSHLVHSIRIDFALFDGLTLVWWLAALGLAVVACRDAAPHGQAPLASGLRRVAFALRARVVVAIIVACLGLLFLGSATGDKLISLHAAIALGAALLEVGLLVVLGLACLEAVHGAGDLPAWPMVVGGALALWAASATLDRLPDLYVTLVAPTHLFEVGRASYSHLDASTVALGAAASVAAVLASLVMAAHRRGLEVTRQRLVRRTGEFVVLALFALAAQRWFVPPVADTLFAALFALAVTVFLIIALWLAASACGEAARALAAGPTVPVARVVKSGMAVLLLLVLAACGGGGHAPLRGDGGGGDAVADGAPDAAVSDLDLLRQLVAALPGAADDGARAALVDAFFHDVAYRGGFPIEDSGQLGVAYYDDAAQGGTFTLAGDFNGWDAGALPLVQPVAGFPFYYLITPLTPPAARSLYKLVHDGSTYFADPHARGFGFDQYGQYSLLASDGTTSHLERWPDVAAAGLAPREVDVYVPAGYVGGTATYPVLYLHDGQNLFDPAGPYGSWKAGDTADSAIASGAIRPVILAGIWNTAARMDEYTQTTDDIPQHAGGEAAEYAQVVDAVVALVDAHYRTRAQATERGVLGSSLGGLVSAYLAVTRPQTFAFAGSMSGTFGWGSIGATDHNPTLMDLAAASPPTGTTFYLDSGGGPPSGGCMDTDHDGVDDDPSGSPDNYCETLDFRATLLAHGWTLGQNLVYTYAPDQPHDEASWASRLPAALQDWFPGPPP